MKVISNGIEGLPAISLDSREFESQSEFIERNKDWGITLDHATLKFESLKSTRERSLSQIPGLTNTDRGSLTCA
jgi:hypothetical protein